LEEEAPLLPTATCTHTFVMSKMEGGAEFVTEVFLSGRVESKGKDMIHESGMEVKSKPEEDNYERRESGDLVDNDEQVDGETDEMPEEETHSSQGKATKTQEKEKERDKSKENMAGVQITDSNISTGERIEKIEKIELPASTSSSPEIVQDEYVDSDGEPTTFVYRDKGKKKDKERPRLGSKIRLQHKKNLLGETIYKGHPSWVLMQNIQTGIRNVVGKSMTQQGTALPGPNDFRKMVLFFESPKILRFPSEGSSHTIPHSTGPFKFKDYCPHAFRHLRHDVFGIDPADYMVSLCNTLKNGENALRELPTPGKSGSLFFFSHDMRFILKTIPKREAKLLRLILPGYFEHVNANHNTLLPRFFGLHRVKPHKGRQVRFVVMGNVFQTKKKIHERYDLKGSTFGRQASPLELQSETVTLKDLDFKQRRGRIQLGTVRRQAFVEQIRKDCKLLEKLNIMDYSLLVGIHYEDREDNAFGGESPLSFPRSNRLAISTPETSTNKMFTEDDGGMRGYDESGHPSREFFYIGIIDILMLYTVRKRLEHTYKTIRYAGEGEISSVSPSEYAARFLEFVNQITA